MSLRKTTAVLLVLLLAGMVLAPMVSAEEIVTTPQKSGTITTDPIRLDDPANLMKTNTVVYSMPEKDQQEIFQAIDNSSLTAKEKTDLKKNLTAIWSGTSTLSDTEMEELYATVYNIIMEPGGPSPKWSGTPVDPNYMDVHNDMAYIAGYSMGLGSSAANTLSSMAGEPDNPPPSASWNHYYSTGAATEAESFAYLAQGEWMSNRAQALNDLAYSMHFMADLSQPFHYSFVQGLPQHAAYESFVGNNWHSTNLNFYNTVVNDGYYYGITDVSDAASYLAWQSHFSDDRYQYINDKILNDPNWQTDSDVIQYTVECLIEGERYQMGLVDYVS
ncbi:MAG: hypothetical protein M0Q92_11980 [Methanoregula sp.]|jgi:hypothetical protein|nr:hypothetical protein [Methanoregula sp.]